MKFWQIILLTVVVTALLAVTVLTWGSLGSAVTGFCLIYLLAAFLFKKYVTDRNSDDFQME